MNQAQAQAQALAPEVASGFSRCQHLLALFVAWNSLLFRSVSRAMVRPLAASDLPAATDMAETEEDGGQDKCRTFLCTAV